MASCGREDSTGRWARRKQKPEAAHKSSRVPFPRCGVRLRRTRLQPAWVQRCTRQGPDGRRGRGRHQRMGRQPWSGATAREDQTSDDRRHRIPREGVNRESGFQARCSSSRRALPKGEEPAKIGLGPGKENDHDESPDFSTSFHENCCRGNGSRGVSPVHEQHCARCERRGGDRTDRLRRPREP